MKFAFPLRRKIVLALGTMILVTLIVFAFVMDMIVVMPRIREQIGASLSTMATQAQSSLTRRLMERALASRDPARYLELAKVGAARPDASWPLGPERAALTDHHPLRDGTELLLLNRDGTVIDGPADLLGSAVTFGGGTTRDDRFFQLVRIGGREFDVGRAVGQRSPDLDQLGWNVVAVQPIDFAVRPLILTSAGTAAFAAMTGLVLLSGGWVIATRATRPLTAIRLAASRLAAGDGRVPIPSIGDYAEVQSLCRYASNAGHPHAGKRRPVGPGRPDAAKARNPAARRRPRSPFSADGGNVAVGNPGEPAQPPERRGARHRRSRLLRGDAQHAGPAGQLAALGLPPDGRRNPEQAG